MTELFATSMSMHKKGWHFALLILFNLLILSSTTNGQIDGASKIDSLHSAINKNKGADKISAQLDLALEIIDKNKDEAQDLTNSALQAAKNSGNTNLEMRSYYVLGRIYTDFKNNDLSLAYFDTAFQIATRIDDSWYKGEILFRSGVNKHRMGNALQALESFNAAVRASRLSENYKISGASYSMMGTIFRMNGFYDRAIEYIIKSSLNYEKAGFTEGSAWAAYLLGRIYADLNLPEKALKYFQEGLEIYSRLAIVDANQTGMAICYVQIGTLNIESGNLEEARTSFENAMKIYSRDESKYGISNVYKNLGKIEYYKRNYTLAENHLNEALAMKNEVGDILSIPAIYEYLGLCQIKRGQTKDGFNTIQKGLDLAISNKQIKIQSDIYAKLTEAYLSTNDLENALASQSKQIEIQNLILSGDAGIKTEQLQAIFEIDAQNSQIAELEKQNEINTLSIKQQRMVRNIMILGIVMALFISVIIYWFYNKIRHKNRELKETNATKDKFFAIIAHDLRGPTGALASLLEHLNSKFDDFNKNELKEILSLLYKSADNVSSLLENLLIWAQSQVDKIEYRPKDLKLSDVLQNALDGFMQSAKNKEIDIRLDGDDQIFVLADPDMVQTIVRNILSNAIKFTPRGGLVSIKCALGEKNMVIISITDNGVGIEKSSITKIFELSNTYHTNGTENEKSTGLGLILVKDFIEKNNGTLTIESEEDKGTVVSFTLPKTEVGEFGS